MGYLFAILGAFAGFFSILATMVALGAFGPGGTDIQLILGGVYGIISAVLLVGAGIIFRMNDRAKKDTSQ